MSCYGRPDYQTPTLDRLAQQGIKFASAYSAAAVCTPTRCAFLTGRYPQRLEVGLQEPLTRRSPTNVGLPPSHPTVASLVRQNGYDTVLIGKWHLGWRPEFGPNQHGYDEFNGILSGAADYFTHGSPDAAGVATGGGRDLWENLTPIERTGYLTDLLTDRAVEYIARKHVRPFYLSLHYTAPHAPWDGPEDAATDHAGHGDGPMTNSGDHFKIFASMMTSLDAGIGRVLAALGRAGLEENTLVIFTSDNGGERFYRSTGRSRQIRDPSGKAAFACRRSSGGRASSRQAVARNRPPSRWIGPQRFLTWPTRSPTRRIGWTARIS